MIPNPQSFALFLFVSIVRSHFFFLGLRGQFSNRLSGVFICLIRSSKNECWSICFRLKNATVFFLVSIINNVTRFRTIITRPYGTKIVELSNVIDFSSLLDRSSGMKIKF